MVKFTLISATTASICSLYGLQCMHIGNIYCRCRCSSNESKLPTLCSGVYCTVLWQANLWIKKLVFGAMILYWIRYAKYSSVNIQVKGECCNKYEVHIVKTFTPNTEDTMEQHQGYSSLLVVVSCVAVSLTYCAGKCLHTFCCALVYHRNCGIDPIHGSLFVIAICTVKR